MLLLLNTATGDRIAQRLITPARRKPARAVRAGRQRLHRSAVVQWLRDGLRLIKKSVDVENSR